MCDEPVQTYVRTEGEWRHFQEYLILQHSEPPLEGVEFRGAEQARVTAEVAVALRAGGGDRDRPLEPDRQHRADAGGAGMREALAGADAPVVAVSPLVGGRSLKGPTEAVHALGRPAGRRRRHRCRYAGLAQGMVVDRGTPTGPPSMARRRPAPDRHDDATARRAARGSRARCSTSPATLA